LLTRVTVVTRDSRRGSGSLDAYVQALNRRIQSMADAHALLSRNRWESVDLGDLVRSQLASDATEANTTIDGPKVALTVATAQVRGPPWPPPATCATVVDSSITPSCKCSSAQSVLPQRRQISRRGK